MKAKELKELLAQIPDNEDVGIEFSREDGEIVFGDIDEVDDETATIVCKEHRLTLQEILKAQK